MGNNYLDLLNSLERKEEQTRNSNVMLVDCMNMFIRGFAMIPAINPQGQPVGGLVGFLRSLNYTIRQHQPTRVILVFDGMGSKTNRQNIDADYKGTRGMKRITNWDFYDNQEQEHASFSSQMDRLIDYLHQLPVDMISVDKQEADDIIAFLAKKIEAEGNKALIVSSDRDYLQLLSDKITVYAPIKKKLYDYDLFVEEYKVLPENYIYYKSLLGDKSDNIPGVQGLGSKTLLKEFPEFTQRILTEGLDFVFDICEKKLDGKKIFAKVLERAERVQINYQLMDLHNIDLLPADEEYVMSVYEKDSASLNVYSFVKMVEDDQLDGHFSKNTESWLEHLRFLTQQKA